MPHAVRPPQLSGARPFVGHAAPFLRDPYAVLSRGQAEHGRAFSFRLGNRQATALLGSEYSGWMLKAPDDDLSIRASYPFFKHMFGPDFFFWAEFEEYRRQRELVLPRFRAGQLDSYLGRMETEARALMARLGGEGEMELVETLGETVMHISAHAFLGADVNERIRGFFPTFRRFSEGLDPVLPGWVPAPHLLRSRRARDSLRRDVLALVRRRRQHPWQEPDFLQTLVDSHFEDGEPVPDAVLVNLILMFLWAGHETTTGHLAWALVDLLEHPAHLARVRAEQRDAGLGEGASAPLTTKDLHRLPLLAAALKETQRLHPVAPMLMRRARRELTVDGWLIPHGSLVLVSPALTHRLPEEWRQPDAYRPERFLKGSGERTPELIGFGGGLHRCLGERFAHLEMEAVLTLLLRHYELELLDSPVLPVPGSTTKWPKSPCRVRYRAKSAAGAAV
ncbi:cytochrome P450 [Streptomyces sulphureus]|uniref:cytochrome P450 n=1 Tax=Streptomyces sulphureus TaxID=47758 RepID=UPI00038096BB|nr:cytochrome P450 [Streptomyces sulphureus]